MIVDLKKYKQYQIIKIKSQKKQPRTQQMNHLQKYQHIPKLQKTKQLQNPYHSRTSAVTSGQPSRIFLLNNREKVSLSQQQSEQSKQNEHLKSIIPTFSRLLTFQRTKLSQQKQISVEELAISISKQQQTMRNIKQEQKNKIKDVIKSVNQHIDSQQDYQKNKDDGYQSYSFDDQEEDQQVKQVGNTFISNNSFNTNDNTINTSIQNNKFSHQKNHINQNTSQPSKEVHRQTIHKSINSDNKYSIPQTTFPNINRNLFSDQKLLPLTRAPTPLHKQKDKKFTHLYYQEDDAILKQEQIADEENIDNFKISKLTQQINMSQLGHSVKPSLHSASQVKQLSNQQVQSIQSRRGSIIDQIMEQNFIQSNVFEGNHAQEKDIKQTQFKKKEEVHHEQTPIKIKTQEDDENNSRNKNSRQHALAKDQGTQTKKVRKTKIFSKTENKGQRIPSFSYTVKQNSSNKPFNKFSDLDSSQKYYYQPEQKKQSTYPTTFQKRHECPYRDVCKQTQCHLKLLQIVDKLTDRRQQTKQNSSKDRISKQEQLDAMNRNIQSEFLRICVSVDELSIQITLHSVVQSNVGGKVLKVKREVQALIERIRNLPEISYTAKDWKKQFGSRQNEYGWQIFNKLQKMCQTLHYIQVVQERYKLWKSKLHWLKQQLRDILSVQKSKQIKKLNEIVKLMKQLQSSRFYDNQNQVIGLVRSYNLFVDEQVAQLNQAVVCIKNDILSI